MENIDLKDMIFAPLHIPTAEEMYTSCKPAYDLTAPFMIDQWPQSVRDVSFPTTLVPVDTELAYSLFDPQHSEWKTKAKVLADQLDEIMDWAPYFIRLNSRSPKDIVDSPITCSGRQAVSWIFASSRCLDDVTVLHYAKAPLYIALRQVMYLHKDAEFRCFAKNGKVIAVSRYFYLEKPKHIPDQYVILDAAKAFYEKHLKEHYPTVVFDLYGPGTEHEILIELNPYGHSDPCLFKTYEEVEKGGERLG